MNTSNSLIQMEHIKYLSIHDSLDSVILTTRDVFRFLAPWVHIILVYWLLAHRTKSQSQCHTLTPYAELTSTFLPP